MNVLPRSPFTTRLSGSARETEQRIRSIVQWKKRRPPVLLLLPALLLIVLCGGLVSCQSRGPAVSLVMDVQYYDARNNVLEIPRLTAQGELPSGAQEVNDALAQLKEQYTPLLSAPQSQPDGTVCLFFPAVTDRFYNLVFYQGSSDYGSDGSLFTLVYDRREDRLLSQEEALNLAGTTLEELSQQAQAFLNDELAKTPEYAAQLTAGQPALEGFRLRENGDVDFYFTCPAQLKDPDTASLDPWQYLFTCSQGTWSHYHPLATNAAPLIPPEELQSFDPPLWYQWSQEEDKTDAGPEFTLTQPGTETVPFAHLLGYSGTVIHTISDNNSEQYRYELTLPDGTVFLLTEHSGQVFHLDLDGDGELELLCGDPQGSLTVFRRWPDGSIRSQELSQAAADLLGLEGTGWQLVTLTFHPESRTVTVQPTSGQETVVFSLSQLLDAAHTGDILLPADQQPLEEDASMVFCDRVNLDGRGGEDDSAVVTSRRVDNTSGGQNVLAVTLGSGETLRWSSDLGVSWPALTPAFLTTTERQCLVLELDNRTSNYGAACYVVLEVANGKLEERFSLDWENQTDITPIYGAYVQTGADGLQKLRLPDLWDKWHAPVWNTLSWSAAEQQLQLSSDLYFTGTYSIAVGENRTLTLALRGRRSQADQLYYDQVQVLEGGQLLQTILPEFPLPASNVFDADTLTRTTVPPANYDPLGFSAESFKEVYLQDINFDGREDLGLPCDTTHTDMHAWYLWDPAKEQFEYAFALAGEITVDEEAQQIIETPFDPETHEGSPAAYSYNARGQLVWMGAPE